MSITIENQGQGKNMTKQLILEELRKRKCRITTQRSLIIDAILENQCSCCKEIYYKVSKLDASIGIATVYRMLALLEEIGAINRKNMYQIQSDLLGEKKGTSTVKTTKAVFLGENNKVELLEANWYNDIKEHLRKKGMIEDEDISIVIKVKKPYKERVD